MVFKKIFKDGTHIFSARKETSQLQAISKAIVMISFNPTIKQIDIYNDGAKLIASIYG